MVPLNSCSSLRRFTTGGLHSGSTFIPLQDTFFLRPPPPPPPCSFLFRNSMTSSVARTALGAGASLALRPSSVQYLGRLETEGTGLLPDASPGKRRATEQDDVVDSSTLRVRGDFGGDSFGRAGDDASHGGDGINKGNTSSSSSGNGTKSKKSKLNRNNTETKKSGGSRGGAGADAGAAGADAGAPAGPEAGAKIRAEAIPPSASAKDANLPARFSDPLRLRLSATAVLPEHEEVCKVGDQVPDMRDMRQDSYLGWGSGVGDSGMPPPPPLGGGGAERARRGSGHYYKVRASGGEGLRCWYTCVCVFFFYIREFCGDIAG